VLDLIAELRRELGVSYLFISHDLHTVRAVCDEIVVMQHGRKLAQVARGRLRPRAAPPVLRAARPCRARAAPRLARRAGQPAAALVA
jgi:ABC-type dipeptide/oligopeptide/nickel transport system ATPase subunit